MSKVIKKFMNYFYKFAFPFFKGERERERLLQVKLAQIIINSSDPEELKNKIVREIASTIKVSRCFFIEYDSSTNNFKKITNAFNRNREDLSVLGFDTEKKIPIIAIKKKYMRSIVIEDTEKFVKDNKLTNSNEDKYLREYNIKASITVRLDYGETFLGVLVVHYDKKNPFLLNHDLEFLKNVAEHVSIALYLGMLYSQEKKEKENEKLLRSIISIMSKEYNLTHITKKIFEILSNVYGAVDIFAKIITKEFQKFYLYKSNSSSFFSADKEFEKSLIDLNIYEQSIFKSLKNNINFIKDTHNFVVQNNIENSYIEEFFISNNIKSVLFLPILYENFSSGLIILHFDKSNILNSEDLDFISSIVNQFSIAVKQSQEFEKEKKTAQREALLRSITERIRSSLNIDETLLFICEEVAKLFNVQRAAIGELIQAGETENIRLRKEYKISCEIKGVESSYEYIKLADFWRENTLDNNGVFLVQDTRKIESPPIRESYLAMGVKSLIGCSIKKDDVIWGFLVLADYNNYRDWSGEEARLLKTISDQIYIAIEQAELYNKVNQKARNEKILHDIILNSVKTFDTRKIINHVVTETGKLFRADRCFFIEIDEMEESNKPIKEYAEYLSSPDIKSHITRHPSKSETSVFMSKASTQRTIVADNIDEVDLPPETRKMLVDDLNVKSYLIASIFYSDIRYGSIVLHYVNDYKKFTPDEIELASSIASQSAIVVHQASLYETTQIQAEREKISRGIVEILRSSTDKKVIKNLFVKNIGKYFKADRVFFSDYDADAREYLPVEAGAEYLSDSTQKSFVGCDWSSEKYSEYIEPLLEKRELKILCWEDYINGNSRGEGFVSRFVDFDVRSSYNLPVVHEGNILGYFCIEFTKQSCIKLSDEDINRIRNMCTQAGIALYQADLLLKAQSATRAKSKLVSNINSGIRDMLDNISTLSRAMENTEVKCDMHVRHLNRIKEIVQNIISFINNIDRKIS